MKRYCQTLTLVDNEDMIQKYVEAHAQVWPEIIEGQRQVGIIDMQIYRRGRQLFMICDTLRVSTVTDRERLTTRDLARATEVKIVERIDTVYIQKDSVSVEDKKIGLSASTDGGSKKSGFLTYVKWIFALICAVVVLIIVVKVKIESSWML